jgi:hypothetical protein
MQQRRLANTGGAGHNRHLPALNPQRQPLENREDTVGRFELPMYIRGRQNQLVVIHL